jgi:hypothetical protein
MAEGANGGTRQAAGTREHQLKRAIRATRFRQRDRDVLRYLVDIADWGTATIPSRFQPRSLDELAWQLGISTSTVQRALDHLVMHGWVTRTRRQSPGRQGAGIAYGLEVGRPCDCRDSRPRPMTGAERARRFRARKQRQIDVTEDGIQRQNLVTYNVTSRYEAAGHAGFPAEEGREEGEGGWMGWPEGSVGAEVNGEP